MKIHSPIAFFCMLILCIGFACNKTEPKKEVPEEIDNPKLREVVGGVPEESSVLVSGTFKSAAMNCKKGFGLCSLQFIDSRSGYSDTTRNKKITAKTYKAVFYLSTASDSLKIEFNEVIPHFEDFFTVESGDTLVNLLGHNYIIPVKGNYKATKDTRSKYGRVEIQVEKGEKQTSYPVNPKKK